MYKLSIRKDKFHVGLFSAEYLGGTDHAINITMGYKDYVFIINLFRLHI